MEEDCLVNHVGVNIIEEGSAFPLSMIHDELNVASTGCQVRGMACAEGFPGNAFRVEAQRERVCLDDLHDLRWFRWEEDFAI